MAKNNEIFDTVTIDLLGNLQSSKNPLKIINDTNKELIIDQYFNGKTFKGALDSIKESVKNSSLSDSIKNKVENLNSDFWKDLNLAFERGENATSNIIINLPNKKYHIIYEITYRPWYISQYKPSVADDFLKNGFNPPSKRSTYQFFSDWIERVYNADVFLLRGKFKDYLKSQNLAYNGLIQTFDTYKSEVNKGDKELRRDFGAVFNLPNDPDPALPGPPTQTISGVANKAPVVDNPNIKLPTQEVKGLDANAAQQATSQAQGAASNAVSQVQSAAGGLTSQVQGVAGQAQGLAGQAQGALQGATDQVQGVAGQAQSAVSGVQESAGGVLSNLSSGVKGAIGGGALGAGIGALAGGGKGALIGVGAGLVTGGIAGKVFDKLNPKGIKPDGLGKDWSPDKFSPESIAGNDKFVDPKTGLVGSTSKLVSGLKGGLLGGGLGAGIGKLAGGGKGALIGGVSGTALGAGLSVGGITGGVLAGGGLGAGIGGLVGGGKGAVIGALSGGTIGAAAAKLASIKNGMPKPNIPKPPSVPRIKTIKIPRPSDVKGAQSLLNLPKSPLG